MKPIHRPHTNAPLVARLAAVAFALLMIGGYAVVVQKSTQRAAASYDAGGSVQVPPQIALNEPGIGPEGRTIPVETLASSSKSLVLSLPSPRFSDMTNNQPQPTPMLTRPGETMVGSTKWTAINVGQIIVGKPAPSPAPAANVNLTPTQAPVVAPSSKSGVLSIPSPNSLKSISPPPPAPRP
jgi:hypothetical protein